jgi:hypothetical protein
MPHWGGVGDSKWLELDRSSSLWEAPCGGRAGGWRWWRREGGLVCKAVRRLESLDDRLEPTF